MTKGKSHSRHRGRILTSILRGQARKLRAIQQRERTAYDQHKYDGSDPDASDG